jgi:hypothetical protein
MTDQVSDTAKQAADQFTQIGSAAHRELHCDIDENPVALGAIGLAIGALLGALVPQSEQEKLPLRMWPVRRVSRRPATQKAADAGGEVAQKFVDASTAIAKDHCLTGGKSLTEFVKGVTSGYPENVKNVARDVLQAGEEAARSRQAGTDGKDDKRNADQPAGVTSDDDRDRWRRKTRQRSTANGVQL